MTFTRHMSPRGNARGLFSITMRNVKCICVSEIMGEIWGRHTYPGHSAAVAFIMMPHLDVNRIFVHLREHCSREICCNR